MTEAHKGRTILSDIRSECLGAYESQPKRIAGDIGNESENQANYHGRFIYELLQNADDVLAERDIQESRFELYGDTLLMAHTGGPFTEEDVRALSILGVSSKSDEHATIGQKGRGFTSVLEICSSPAIFSDTYDFCYDRQLAYEEIDAHLDIDEELTPSNVPVLTLPFAPGPRPERVSELLDEDTPYTTVFVFDLREGLNETIKKRLASIDPHIMLFLRYLQHLEISINGEELRWELTRSELDVEEIDSEATRIDISCIKKPADWGPSSTEHRFVRFRRKNIPVTARDGLEGPNWEEIEYTEVGTALRYELRDGAVHLQPFESVPKIHLFLPTEEASPVPLLLNGAFKPDSSRKGIPIVDEESGYNAFLLDELATLIANDVLNYAATTATTTSEFLSCIDLGDAVESTVATYLKDQIADEMVERPFLPIVDGDDDLTIGSDRWAPADLVLPYSHVHARKIGARIVELYGPDSIPPSIDPQERRFPKPSLLFNGGYSTLRSLNIAKLEAPEIPPLLASAPSDRTQLHSYEEVGLRREVDPVLNVLIGIDEVTSDAEIRDTFSEACSTTAVFPTSVLDDGTIVRIEPGGQNLLFPPEEFSQSLELEGVEFLAPTVYRPSGWTRPRGEHGDTDDFQSQIDSLWDIDEFDFQSFAQAAILPRLPRSRRPVGDPSDLESISQLQVLQELSGDTVKRTSPLPHQPRKDEDLYRLCMLPVPTADDEWKPAYRVYFGDGWYEDYPEHAKPQTIFAACPRVDPPILASPEKLVEDATDEESIEHWRDFFRWLGVTPHLRLTPIFNPTAEREYRATSNLGRPSETHPTLGALPESSWIEFQSQLRNAVEESAASERDNLSIYRVSRLEFWPNIREATRTDQELACLLFCHLAYWWEERYGGATTVGVGGHSVSAGQVASRSKGVPNSNEKYQLGHNLWLWELRNAEWCPSIHGQYPPTRVWQRTESLVEQFRIADGEVLLPVLHDEIGKTLHGPPPESLCRALGIRATLARGDFEPADAEIMCELLADLVRNETDEQLQQSLPTIRTAYRELAQVLPPRRPDQRPEVWEESDATLGDTEVICIRRDEEFVLRSAADAFYVTSRAERSQIPLSDPAVFVLQETDAGAYGAYFGMPYLIDAVESKLPEKDIHPRSDLTNSTKSLLDTQSVAIRCVLLRDRPSQQEEDRDGINRFIEELTVVSQIEVVYTLGDLEERTKRAWFIDDPPDGGQRRTPYIAASNDEDLVDILDTVAKALCEYLEYPNIGDVVLLLRAESQVERERKLELLDAPRDLLNGDSREIGGLGLQSVQEDKWMDPNPEKEGEHSEIGGQKDPTEEVEARTSTMDPSEQLWQPDDLSFTLEDGTEIPSAGLPTDLELDRTGNISSGGSGSNDANPGMGGIRTAVGERGETIAYRFECERFADAHNVDDPENFVFFISDKSHISRARKTIQGQPVLQWLTEDVGLDRTYPGFDILSVHPDSDSGAPVVDRLVEVKSLKGEGPVSISLNEWHTATSDELQTKYYLYVVAHLGLESSGHPFIRIVENPGDTLLARPKQQRTVTLEVDTKRFAEGGSVKEVPLRDTTEED